MIFPVHLAVAILCVSFWEQVGKWNPEYRCSGAAGRRYIQRRGTALLTPGGTWSTTPGPIAEYPTDTAAFLATLKVLAEEKRGEKKPVAPQDVCPVTDILRLRDMAKRQTDETVGALARALLRVMVAQGMCNR